MDTFLSRPFTPKTDAALQAAEEVFLELVLRVPAQLGTDPKHHLLMSFNAFAMEHFRAIVLLCRSRVAIGSALALFRPFMDSVVRGEWLYLCASEEQREAFMKRELDLGSIGFTRLTDAIDAEMGVGGFLAAFQPYYKQMCDFTHTGHDAIAVRMSDSEQEALYSEDRVRSLLITVARVTLIHFANICGALSMRETKNAVVQLFAFLDAAEAIR